MYINVGVGNINNQKPFNFVSYDFDSKSLKYWDYNSGSVKPIDQASTSNYGIRKWPILNQEGTQITDGAIALFVELQYMENSSHIEIKDNNQAIIDGLGFGLFNSEQDSIITKAIQYTNRVSGEGYSSSESNVEYTEVTPTEEAPENWEEERLYAYFFGSEQGSGQQVAYVYRQIAPTYYEWDDIYAYLQNNPGIKLYKNTELSKRIVIGTAEKCVSFNVTKGDYSPGSTYMYPFVTMYGRSANVNSPGTYSGGMIIAGDDPTDPAYSLWVANNNPFNTQGFGWFTQASTDQLTPFYTNGRLSTTAPATKAHPVTECTLFQFGQMKYNGKTYIGVWRVTYKSAYYWGYKGSSSSTEWTPGSWSALSDIEVAYNAQMNTYDRIQKIAFNGICLDDIDVVPDIREGDPPIDPPSGDGDYKYPNGRGTFMGNGAYNILSSPISSGLHIYYLTGTEFSYLIDAFAQWDSWSWQLTNELQSVTTAQPGETLWAALSRWLTSALNEPPGASTGDAFMFNPLATTVNAFGGAAKNRSADLQSNIVFCRKMPNFITSEKVVNNSTPLVIGPATITAITPDYFQSERIECSETFDFSLPFVTNTFLDLQPYVKSRVFLPFYGDVDVPVDAFIGGSLTVHYVADILTGKGAITIRTISYDGYEAWFGPYICDMSVSVPLMQVDANGTSRNAAIVKAAAATALDVATGNYAGAIRAGANIYDALDIKSVSQSITTLGSDIGLLTPNSIRIQLTYPKTITQGEESGHNIDNTIAQIGISSYVNGKVSDFLTGKITKYSYVNTSGINATEAEKREIEALLKGGVY